MGEWVVDPVEERTGIDGERWVAPVLNDEDADYFGLYYRGEDGLAQWQADFRTRKLADGVAQVLNAIEETP